MSENARPNRSYSDRGFYCGTYVSGTRFFSVDGGLRVICRPEGTVEVERWYSVDGEPGELGERITATPDQLREIVRRMEYR